jgi:hypothetical protein
MSCHAEIRLLEVGPAHTRGDIMVHLPADRGFYIADILFVGRHPIVWRAQSGTGQEHSISSSASTSKPLSPYTVETLRRYEAGLSPLEAVLVISFSDNSARGEQERIVANVEALYREFGTGGLTPLEVLSEMA